MTFAIPNGPVALPPVRHIGWLGLLLQSHIDVINLFDQ